MNIEEIFQAALGKISPAERKAYLDQACNGDSHLRARVERLLHANENVTSGFLENPPSGLAADRPDDIPATESHHREQTGSQIGPYRLLQKLGEGGMGTVYMAEQKKPVERRVALKIIKPGMDSGQVIARFEAERQALAMMDHPNIAKVFDAGATALGRPYFVMELVKGIPITQYCDENHLTTKQRLELFVEVCHAVQHAHQKGIIHRDLKPQNVLVADYDHKPVPKVIDFGIAKATTQRLTEKTVFTEIGAIVGTLEYMSPEQAKLNQLDVDTRTDVYSLGVLLYQLLTGMTPIESSRLRSAGLEEMLRIIREDEPPKPSTRISSWGASAKSLSDSRRTNLNSLKKMVQGDLDWIVMKAIEKDRARRYDSANAFADDVSRYLNDELVAARSPSAMYRTTKFVRRNKRTLVSAAAILALVGLSAFVFRTIALGTERANKFETAKLHVNQVLGASEDTVREFLSLLPSDLFGAEVALQESDSDEHTKTNGKATLNARIALLNRGDATYVQPLLESMLTATAGYHAVICDLLEPHKAGIEDGLWKELSNKTNEEKGLKRRFLAGLALANFAPNSAQWSNDHIAFIAKQILRESPADQAVYLRQVKLIAKECLSTWKKLFINDDVFVQVSAAYALEFFERDGLLPKEEIVKLLVIANPKQFQILYPLLGDRDDKDLIAQLRKVAATPLLEDTKSLEEIKQRWDSKKIKTNVENPHVTAGQARAGAGIALMRLGELQSALDMFLMESDLSLQGAANDPEAIAQFIHRCRDRGITADVIAKCLESLDNSVDIVATSKETARYALLLALAEFPEEDVPPVLLERLVKLASDWYRDHPRSSVHGATRWLLTNWNKKEKVDAVDRTPIPYSPDREWFTREIQSQKEGESTFVTFIVFPGGEFKIGSPNHELMRQKNEDSHLVRITHPYALADREITRSEIKAFCTQFGIPEQPFPSSPISAGPGLNWYQSVQYCRWLNERDGMTESNQPYSANDAREVKDSSTIPELDLGFSRDWLLRVERPGFRLPTEDEWEVAARSGVRTQYFFGGDWKLVEQYAWMGTNTDRTPQEPKTRKPSLRGLFDMHGNMFEWCHDWFAPYERGEVQSDWTGPETGGRRSMRGGCWGVGQQFCRNSTRFSMTPSTPFGFIGFRVAMTLPSDEQFARSNQLSETKR